MQITRTETETGVTINIAGKLTIYTVNEIRDRLVEGFADNKQLDVNLHQVTECDVAGLQVLLAARKTSSEKGLQLTISDVPEIVSVTMTRMGLETL